MTTTRIARGALALLRPTAICLVMCAGRLSAQNLINNGNFELGNGVGFSSLYNFIAVPTGTTTAGQYGVGSNPHPYNTASFINMGDRTTGTGNMLIVDGTNNSGNPEPVFWRVGASGEICGLVVGQPYTFRYWIRSIYQAGIPGASVADVRVRWNNVQDQGGNGWSLAPTSGSTFAPAPGTAWAQVTYTIIPTNACVRIEMFNLNGSFAGNDFAIDDIELLPPPQPLSLSYSITNVTCFGAGNGAIMAYASGGTMPYQRFSLGGPVNATNTTGIFTNLPPGNYTLSVTDAATPLANTVTVNNLIITQPPNLVVNPATASICPGNTITLTATGAPVTNWTANPFDASLTTPAAQSITVSPAQTTTYTVTATQTQTINLIYNGDFSLGNVGFASDHQFFTPANPSGAQRTYGIVANAQSWWSTFSPCTDRSGTGKMMVVDGSTFNGGADRVWCQTVPVQPGNAYLFSYWIQSLTHTNLAGIVVTINGVAISPEVPAPATTCNWQAHSYSWNSGAANWATICIFNRTTTSSGNDFALDDLTFTTTTTCTLTGQATVTVSGASSVTGFSYTTPVCAGSANLLPALVSGFTGGGIFSATPAGLSINAATGAINVAASAPGTYNINYTVAPSGCNTGGTSSFTFTITNSVTPVTGFSYASPVCTNFTNPLPITVPGFTSGGTFSSTSGLTINPSTGFINLSSSMPGTYTVTYTLAATGCNAAASSTATIIINAAAVPVTAFSYTTPVCLNSANPVPLTAVDFSNGGTFTAGIGLAINAATGVIDLANSLPGSYTVRYTVAAAACRQAGSATATIVLQSAPLAPVVQSPIAYCQNAATVPLTATGAALRWYTTASGGTALATAPRPASTTPGNQTYYVSQTVNGCESPRALLEVIIHPLPVANAGADKQVRAGQSVQLDGAATGNSITVLWTPQQFMINPSSTTPTVSPLTDITYTIIVTSVNGCEARDAVRVTVLRDLIVPNVFSPNGDNINDKWILKFIEQYPDNRVQLFNRYGQLLFETKGYSSSNAWDGSHNGKALPVGAYYYIIHTQEGAEPLRGSVSIIR